MIFFVTGTDTGIGKTYATALLARGFRALGQRVALQKPVQTGATSPEDLELAARIAGLKLPSRELSCPYVFSYPAAPETAAALEGQKIDLLRLKRAAEELSRSYDVVLIEGAGGLYVPLTREDTILDFINLLMCPVFVVSAARLGTINHTVLTVNALKQRGLFVAGLLYNWHFATDEFLARKSLEDIRRLTGVEDILEFPTIREHIPEELLEEVVSFLKKVTTPRFDFNKNRGY